LRLRSEQSTGDGSGTKPAAVYPPLVPNAETVAAMEDARLGNLAIVGTVEALLADLHAKA
jgi:hypothetical protein